MNLYLANHKLSSLFVLLTAWPSPVYSDVQFDITPVEPLKFDYGKTKIPYAVSDMTASVALTSDSDDDPLVFLIGGCDSPTGNKRAEWDNELFYCNTITDRTIAYDPEKDEFVNKKNMLRERYRHAAAVVDGMIWIVGGRDVMDNIVHEVDMYNPLTDEWTYIGNMTESLARSDLTAFASPSEPNSFFVTGGYDTVYNVHGTTLRIDTIESIAQNEIVLSTMKDMPTPRGDLQSVVLNNDRHAYVLGGYSPSNNWCEALHVVEMYDLEADEWSSVDDMKNERGDKAAVILNDKIYVIGGETKDGVCDVEADTDPAEAVLPMDDVEVFDAGGSREWTVLQEIPSERFRFTGVAYPKTGTIYIFGGQKFYDKTCDCYATSDAVLYLTNDDEASGVRDILSGYHGSWLAAMVLYVYISFVW